MSRSIALTGATGFIGSTLTRRLASAGWQIQALLRPASTPKQPRDIAVKWINGDLGDLESLRRLVHGVDAVVHCAGAVRGATRTQFNLVNADGVKRLVQAAAEEHPAPRFLLISSLAAREPHLSLYAASKRQGETVLTTKAGKMSWTIFRLPAVYGPGDRELQPVFRWMAKGIAPILGSADARFSLLYVEDLAEAVVRWLDCGNGQSCIFELHDGRPGGYSWRDVIETVKNLRGKPVTRVKVPEVLVKVLSAINLITARAVGYAPMLTPGKVRELLHPNWVCDNAALSTATGWTPRILLEEGLRRTLSA